MNNSQLFDLSRDFNTLDLLEQCRKSNKLTDVELQVGDKLFPAHRAVLSLYSPVLEAAVSDQWSTTRICPLSEEYVDVEIVENLLSFLYTGKIKLTPENTHPVCVAAHFLQISKLLDVSVKHLCKFITSENVFSLFEFSFNCKLKVLQESCLEHIQVNHEVFQDRQIMRSSFRNFQGLIIGLSEKSISREDTYNCIVRWVEENVLERSEHLPNLLENIPLEELSFDFLTQTVSKQKLVFESISCAQALLKAFGQLRSFSQSSKRKQSLIVIGGKRGDNSEVSISAQMSRYNEETNTWQGLPDMRHPRYGFGAAVVNERDIIVCGGYKGKYETITDSVEMFNWAKQAWEELPSMPIGLINCSIVEHNDHLYVAGQTVRSDEKFVLCYSLKGKSWSYFKFMKLSLAEFHTCLFKFKEHLYVIGDGNYTAVKRFDLEQNLCETVTHLKASILQCKATLHENKIFLCGNSSLEVYDPEKNVWDLPIERDPKMSNSTFLVSMNSKLIAVGVGDFNERSQNSGDAILELNPTSGKWVPIGQMNSKLAFYSSVVGHFD